MKLIAAPTTLPVSLAEAKMNGRIDGTTEDALITAYIQAALATAERGCGVAFEPQTWQVTLDSFGGEISLPFGPVASVVSIAYDDEDGDPQTVPSEGYTLDGETILPVGDWPAGSNVRVQWIAGTGTPADVRVAILLMVQSYYENRAAVVPGSVSTLPLGVEAILSLHRQMFV